MSVKLQNSNRFNELNGRRNSFHVFVCVLVDSLKYQKEIYECTITVLQSIQRTKWTKKIHFMFLFVFWWIPLNTKRRSTSVRLQYYNRFNELNGQGKYQFNVFVCVLVDSFEYH